MLRSASERRSFVIALKVTAIEKRYLEACAKKAELCVATYVHRLVTERRLKKPATLPPEVIAFKGQLLHLCGELYPFSQKRLDGEEFNALERAEVKQIIQTAGELTRQIKNNLK
jgi:hypothetical protein